DSETADAVQWLSNEKAGKPRDKAIHQARKSVKKLRGLLRLIKPEMGKLYVSESTALRDIGRALSELRDAAAILETFTSVVNEYSGELKPSAVAVIRKGLQKRKR